MPVLRKNAAANLSPDVKEYIEGVWALKKEVGADGVNTYDKYVDWHVRAMMENTPPTTNRRNAAHEGPSFLPWHRWMLRRFEEDLQRVRNNPNFGIPYWDWTADVENPSGSVIWEMLGSSGTPVSDGAFRFDAVTPPPRGNWIIRNYNQYGELLSVQRGLHREFDDLYDVSGDQEVLSAVSSPSTAHYDESPWHDGSAAGFRNTVEGNLSGGDRIHNGVHSWIGHDMMSLHSPNDPVFYLIHSNLDRIWRSWQQRHPAAPYVPPDSASSDLYRHRLNDPLHPFSVGDPVKSPALVLDSTALYTYDVLI